SRRRNSSRSFSQLMGPSSCAEASPRLQRFHISYATQHGNTAAKFSCDRCIVTQVRQTLRRSSRARCLSTQGNVASRERIACASSRDQSHVIAALPATAPADKTNSGPQNRTPTDRPRGPAPLHGSAGLFVCGYGFSERR